MNDEGKNNIKEFLDFVATLDDKDQAQRLVHIIDIMVMCDKILSSGQKIPEEQFNKLLNILENISENR